MTYCVQTWRPHLRKDINKLEAVQKRLIRMIPGLKGTTYTDKLKEVGIISLEERHRRLDLVEVFKITNDFEGLKSEKFFQRVSEVSQKETRSTSELKLHVKKSNIDIHKYHFAQRVVSDWNALPLKIRQAQSIDFFKKKMNDYLNAV